MPPVGTDKPRCARCLRPVDRVEHSRDGLTEALTITVFCHGAIESVTLTDDDLLAAKKDSFRFTVAFSHTRAAEQSVADGAARRRRFADLLKSGRVVFHRDWHPYDRASVHETGTTRMPPRPFIRGPGMAEAMHVAAAAFRSAAGKTTQYDDDGWAGPAPAHATHVIIDDPIKSALTPMNEKVGAELDAWVAAAFGGRR